MKFFWTIWIIDAIASFIILYFFIIGLLDGSVSSYNAVEWLFILLGVAGVLSGSIYFIRKGKKGVAWLLLCLLAIPAALMGIFLMILLFGDVNWQ